MSSVVNLLTALRYDTALLCPNTRALRSELRVSRSVISLISVFSSDTSAFRSSYQRPHIFSGQLTRISHRIHLLLVDHESCPICSILIALSDLDAKVRVRLGQRFQVEVVFRPETFHLFHFVLCAQRIIFQSDSH